MYAMKYRINNDEWLIKSQILDPKWAFSHIAISGDSLTVDKAVVQLTLESVPITIPSVLGDGPPLLADGFEDLQPMSMLVPVSLFGLTSENIQFPTSQIVHGQFTIIIQKMTSAELENIEDATEVHSDIFDWLKQKIENTSEIPSGFAIPIVNQDTITIVSQAMVVASEGNTQPPSSDPPTSSTPPSTTPQFKNLTLVTASGYEYSGSSKDYFDTEYLPKFQQIITEFMDKMRNEYNGVSKNPAYPNYGLYVENLTRDNFTQIVRDSLVKLRTILPDSFIQPGSVGLKIVENTENKVRIEFENVNAYRQKFCFFEYRIDTVEVVEPELGPEK